MKKRVWIGIAAWMVVLVTGGTAMATAATEEQAAGDKGGATGVVCVSYADEDNDGVCDRVKEYSGQRGGYADEDNDGVCDRVKENCGQRGGAKRGYGSGEKKRCGVNGRSTAQ